MKDLLQQFESNERNIHDGITAKRSLGYTTAEIAHGQKRVADDFPLPPVGRRLRFAPEDIILPEPGIWCDDE